MARDNNGKLPWDQREGETDKAYDAFRLFLEMPRAERSVEGAWRKWRERAGRGGAKPPGQWATWAYDHDWKERVREWDREADIKRVAVLDAERRKRIEQLAERMERDATLAADLSSAAMAIAANGLEKAKDSKEAPGLGQVAAVMNAAAKMNALAVENLAKLAGVEDVLYALDSVEADLKRNGGGNP